MISAALQPRQPLDVSGSPDDEDRQTVTAEARRGRSRRCRWRRSSASNLLVAVVALVACKSVPAGRGDAQPGAMSPSAVLPGAPDERRSSGISKQNDSNPPEPAVCDTGVEPRPSEDLSTDWTHKSFEKGWVGALSADSRGVLAAGAAHGGSPPSQPAVMRITPEGREVWRINLDKEIRSTVTPPHSAAVAITGTASGHAYVVSTAVRSGTGTTAYLTRIDAAGKSQWTTELALSMWLRFVLDENENVVLVGTVARRGGAGTADLLGVEKYDPQGSLVWSHRYPYSGPTPHVGRTSRGSLVLAVGFHGVATLSDTDIRVEGNLNYQCADRAEAVTYDPVRALLTFELDADGQLVKHQLFEAKGASIGVSGLTVLEDDRVFITGEYFGPEARIGSASLCEIEPGMPAAEMGWEPQREFGKQPLSCEKARRDLYVMELDNTLRPLWAKTLALGHPTPQLAGGNDGKLLWFVESSDGAHASMLIGKGVPERSAWLWNIDTDGRALRRRSLGVSAFEAVAIAPDGSVFTARNHTITKFSSMAR